MCRCADWADVWACRTGHGAVFRSRWLRWTSNNLIDNFFLEENVNHIVYDLYEENNIINKGREGNSCIQIQQGYIFSSEYVKHVCRFWEHCLAVLSSTFDMKYDFSFRILDSYTPHSWLNYRSIWLSSKSYMFASHIKSVFCFRGDLIINFV